MRGGGGGVILISACSNDNLTFVAWGEGRLAHVREVGVDGSAVRVGKRGTRTKTTGAPLHRRPREEKGPSGQENERGSITVYKGDVM